MPNEPDSDQKRTAEQQERAKKYSRIIARTWADPAFKQRLLANPEAVLREEGVAPPPGKKVKVVENTDDTVYLVLPRAPEELSDEQLSQVAGGARACECDITY